MVARAPVSDSPGHLPREVFQACPTGRRPRGRPRTCWRDYVSWLVSEHFGILPEVVEEENRVEKSGHLGLDC